MRDVARFAGIAHSVTFDCLRQHNGRLTLVMKRRMIGGVNFVRVVPAAVQAPDVVVGHVRDHGAQLRILAEEMLAYVRAAVGAVGLIVAVQRFFHSLFQRAAFVLIQQRVPIRPPHNFENIPPRAAKDRLQLLYDFAVAAHGTVKALQVAIDDEDEIVQTLARRQ